VDWKDIVTTLEVKTIDRLNQVTDQVINLDATPGFRRAGEGLRHEE
jgi:hypothetical protein